ASATVGNVATPPGPGGMPPLARKPVVEHGKPPTGAQSIVVDNCGGSDNKPRLSKRTSYAIPAPARIEVRPLDPGEYAKPMRGPQLFFAALGVSNSIKPGALAPALRLCDR